MNLILASNSPRRRDILERFGYDFKVIKSNFNENANAFDPVETVIGFSKGKAFEVFDRLGDKQNSVVLGADTVVFAGGKILGKPKIVSDAVSTLKFLSGKAH